MNSDVKGFLALVVVVGGLAVTLVGGLMFGIPVYNRWRAGISGQAEYIQAEQNRQIKVLEAKAAEDSAKSLAAAQVESAKGFAQSEIEKAKGVAEANRIIGQSLHDNEAYLRYLWITSMQGGKDQVIYIPTEAGMPLLEAGRFTK